jgi:hypothetical protein
LVVPALAGPLLPLPVRGAGTAASAAAGPLEKDRMGTMAIILGCHALLAAERAWLHVSCPPRDGRAPPRSGDLHLLQWVALALKAEPGVLLACKVRMRNPFACFALNFASPGATPALFAGVLAGSKGKPGVTDCPDHRRGSLSTSERPSRGAMLGQALISRPPFSHARDILRTDTLRASGNNRTAATRAAAGRGIVEVG